MFTFAYGWALKFAKADSRATIQNLQDRLVNEAYSHSITRRNHKLSLLTAILFIAAKSAFADSLFSGLKNDIRAKPLQFTVSEYHDANDKTWIRVYCEYEGYYRQKIDDVTATLWDFKAAPDNFKRIESVRMISDNGSTAIYEQRTGVHLMGLSYVSNIVFKETLAKSKKQTVLKFESIKVDDTTLSNKGSWTLEDRTDSSGCLTYARYTLETYVAARYPAQEALMREFGQADIYAIMQQLDDAVANRPKKTDPTVAATKTAH
jgi:hypothetical protein